MTQYSKLPAAKAIIATANGFLFDLTLRDVAGATFAQCRFDQAAYDPSLFQILGVDFPDTLRTAVQKRQVDFLAGRLVARIAMGAGQVPIGPNRGPVWPHGVNGSITHSHGACAALVADAKTLCGVDIEKVAAASALDAILARCVSVQERAWIAAQIDLPQDVAATLVFSAKESIFKALSGTVGQFFGFDCAAVQGHEAENILTFTLTEHLHPTLPKGFEIPVAFKIRAGYVLTWILMPSPDA